MAAGGSIQQHIQSANHGTKSTIVRRRNVGVWRNDSSTSDHTIRSTRHSVGSDVGSAGLEVVDANASPQSNLEPMVSTALNQVGTSRFECSCSTKKFRRHLKGTCGVFSNKNQPIITLGTKKEGLVLTGER